jgi:hypothetical protein
MGGGEKAGNGLVGTKTDVVGMGQIGKVFICVWIGCRESRSCRIAKTDGKCEDVFASLTRPLKNDLVMYGLEIGAPP